MKFEDSATGIAHTVKLLQKITVNIRRPDGGSIDASRIRTVASCDSRLETGGLSRAAFEAEKRKKKNRELRGRRTPLVLLREP